MKYIKHLISLLLCTAMSAVLGGCSKSAAAQDAPKAGDVSQVETAPGTPAPATLATG